VVVVGSQGQLGSHLCSLLGSAAVGLDRTQLDITDRTAVLQTLGSMPFSAVINAAAYSLVDQAEQEPDVCEAVNALAVEYLGEACQRQDAVLVQVSTDYVFGGDRQRRIPYREDDVPAPLGVYARSKHHGELAAMGCSRHFVVRTCGLYGVRPAAHRAGNFVDTMLRLSKDRSQLRVVADQQCTPTYVPDLARAIQFLLSTDAYGTFHIVNSGVTTWHGFATEIFRKAGRSTTVEAITSEQYGSRAPRPSFSVLDTSKYNRLSGAPLPDWKTALADYLHLLN
jgi:dTDP-4-dehydrorhamnose reductase